MQGVFLAAKDDYDAGFLFTVRSLINAEDSAEVIDQASDLLDAGYKDPACVVAGVALELAIKELCARNSISPIKLEAVNTELCKSGVYHMGMQK